MFGVISLLWLKNIQVFIQLYNVVRLVMDLNENANKHTTFLFSDTRRKTQMEERYDEYNRT